MILGCKPDYFGAMTQRLLGQKTGAGSRHENFHIELIRAGFDKREGVIPIDPVDPKIEICFVTSQSPPARRWQRRFKAQAITIYR